MKIVSFILLFAALLHTGCSGPSEGSEELRDFLNETEEEFDARMAWWRDATFGMFIHWGVYAVPAGVHQGKQIAGIGEWIMDRAEIPIAEYEKYAQSFNPVLYDADEWVRIAKTAGMKYIVITSKHHDGFCLWDSDVTDYDAVDYAPVNRDLLADLKSACDKHGIRLCFYHSIMDWRHPDAQGPHFPDYNTSDKVNPNFDRYYTDYLKPQVKELIEKYDPHVLWFDGEWIPEFTHEHGLDLYQYVRELKPGIIINNRVDKGRQGMQGMNREDQQYAGDFGTPEQEILEGTSSFDWESCMTMNDTWGYKSLDHNWKSTETLIHNLIDITAKGGNYLLNIGPTAEGLIPQPSIDRLLEMGNWLEVNGEAIYATERLSRFKEGESIYLTRSKNGMDTYVIFTSWPEEIFSFTQVKPKPGSQIYMLGIGQPLEWTTDGNTTSVPIPQILLDPINRPCDHAWVLKVENISN